MATKLAVAPPPAMPRMQEVLITMHKIESECGGFSSIPLTHETYWDLKKELQRIIDKN